MKEQYEAKFLQTVSFYLLNNEFFLNSVKKNIL